MGIFFVIKKTVEPVVYEPLMAVTSAGSPYLNMYNTGDWSSLDEFDVMPAYTGHGVAFSPDDSMMAVGYGDEPYLTLYNTIDWSKIDDPAIMPEGTVLSISFSPDGSLMVIGFETDPLMIIYNTSDWSKVADPEVMPGEFVHGSAFSPDGSLLALATGWSPDSTTHLVIYNTSDWSKVPDPDVMPGYYSLDVTFSHDGSLMVVGHTGGDTNDRYITIYNTSDWSKVSDPEVLPSWTVHSVRFSPDDSVLAVGVGAAGGEYGVVNDNTSYLVLYNTSDWSKIPDPDVMPEWTVGGVGFSPDGLFLAITYADSEEEYSKLIIYNTLDWSKVDDPSVLPSGNGKKIAFNSVSPTPDPERFLTIKSIIFDMEDTWGVADFLGLKTIEVLDNSNNVLSDHDADTVYATSSWGEGYEAQNVLKGFKTGSAEGKAWAGSTAINQRLIIVFHEPINFSKIVINNFHDSGSYADSGAKNAVITMSPSTITDTTYAGSISDGTVIFTGQFDRHPDEDVVKNDVLALQAPVETTITGWLIQTSGSYPDVSSIRVSVGRTYLELTDHITSTTDTTASVLFQTASCEGFTYHQTFCNFTFTADPGDYFRVQVWDVGDAMWYDAESLDPNPHVVPDEDSTITLGCNVY